MVGSRHNRYAPGESHPGGIAAQVIQRQNALLEGPRTVLTHSSTRATPLDQLGLAIEHCQRVNVAKRNQQITSRRAGQLASLLCIQYADVVEVCRIFVLQAIGVHVREQSMPA